MSTTDPTHGPFQEQEPFDPVELATEPDAVEFAEQTEAEGRVAAEEPADSETAPREDTEPPAQPQSGLLQRALKAAGSDAARYLPVRFIPALTSLITTPLFTRVIDPGDYGAFYLISSLTAVLAALAVTWLQSSAIRFYWPSRKAGRLDNYIATIAWTALGSLASTAAVVGIAVFFARGSIDPVVLRLVPIGLVYFIANFYTTAMMQILRAANRAGLYAKLQVATTLLVTLGSVALVWFAHWGALGILMGAAAGNLIVAPFILRGISQEGSLDPRNTDRELLRELLTYGMPLVPSALAGQALVVLDRFIIQFFRGAAEVGVYSVSYALGDKIMQLITMPLLLTMMPSLIEAYEKHGQKLAEGVQTQFTRYFAILTLPLLAGMTVAAPVFMHVFTGPQYRSAYGVLGLVAAASMLGSFAQIAGAGLGMHKKTKLIMVNTVMAATLNTVLNIIFVPRYGYMAAAWATVASYGLLLFATWMQSRRYMRWIIPWAELARIGAACIGMSLAIIALARFFSPNLWLLMGQVGLGVVVYVGLLLVFGGIRADERAFLGGIVSRGLGRMKR